MNEAMNIKWVSTAIAVWQIYLFKLFEQFFPDIRTFKQNIYFLKGLMKTMQSCMKL